MPIEKIIIVGCGGIGSFLIRNLYEFSLAKQFGANSLLSFIDCYDDDSVEQKNLLYQNYTIEDIYETKASIMTKRYGVNGIERRMINFNIPANPNLLIVCCVDNAETRLNIFKNGDKYDWIDLRCQGKSIAVYTKSERNNYDYMVTTLPKESEEGSGSCQYAADINAGIIQNGNRIVAAIGAQAILNKYRGDSMSSRFLHGF